MTVLLTGGAGMLGRALGPALADQGEVRVFDLVDPGNGLPFVQGDLRNFAEILRATEGVDMIAHVGALHPIRHFTDQEYLEVNVKGTYHVLQAAHQCGVRRVVFTSTIWAIGHPPERPPYLPVDERAPCHPQELYGMTKLIGEQLCEMFSRVHGLSTICLRAGTFVPKEKIESGFRLLWGGIDLRDLVQSDLLALEVGGIEHETFIIMPNIPWTPQDAEASNRDPESVIARYFPEAIEPMRQAGIEPPPIEWYYDTTKAKQMLGFHPKHNFGEFLGELLR